MRTASLLASFGVFSLAVASTSASAKWASACTSDRRGQLSPITSMRLLIAPCLECMVIRGAMMV